MNRKEVIALAKSENVKVLDLKFCDIHGAWHHFTVPIHELTEEIFHNGFGFDGSSIRGWKSMESSDMLVIPDVETAFLDPFVEISTLSLICDIIDPATREPYDRSPRSIAKRAQAYLQATGIADTAYFGPEAEFFIFDDVRFHVDGHESFYFVDSDEAYWNNDGQDGQPSQGYKIRQKGGYMPVQPSDKLMDIRNEMIMTMMDLGLKVERQHHEVATAGQCEIDIRYDTLVKMADSICLYKYVVKNVAYQNGKTATFMPKPIFGDNGSGMHVHMSFWNKGKTLMAGDLAAGLSQEALWMIGGLLKHSGALCAICNPTNNSYKRLIPGYEAPVTLAYSASNRTAICRIPTYDPSPQAKRIEYRCPDPSANPYLAFAALQMAMIDGIENKIDPGAAMNKNLYDLTPEEASKLQYVPGSLKCALNALAEDHAFLTKGGVFTEDFIQTFIQLKEEEFDAVRLRPHPQEYVMYYDV